MGTSVTGLLTLDVSTLTQLCRFSVWGTLLASYLAPFLTDNPLPDGYPWGNLTDYGNNPYRECPHTGVTRSYEFTISRGVIAPDGYEREVLLVNGAFPGPLIEANWGDTIIVKVFNNISNPEEGTSIHWHGFLQHDTPWEDGAPGITQCPIPPGKTYTYEFSASLYGTTWYHAHYSAQYAGGIVGPIVIHGPTREDYDIDVGPVMLGGKLYPTGRRLVIRCQSLINSADWYHQEYYDIIKTMLSPSESPPRVYSDNNLINGKMDFNCSTDPEDDPHQCTPNAGISKFRFQTGQIHRLRLINLGGDGIQRFSIDEHVLTVIAEDFVPVKPYNTTVVVLGVGQRADVLVTANAGGPKSAFWMRSSLTTCSPARQPNAVAVVLYDEADENAMPNSKPWEIPNPDVCANLPLDITEPLYPIPLPEPTFTETMEIEIFKNESKIWLWKFNDVSMRTHYNKPVLLLANQGEYDYPEEWNVVNYYQNKSVRIVVKNNSPTS